MAESLDTRLVRLGEKSRFLVERYRVVVQQRDQAFNTIEVLQKTLLEREKELQQLKMQVDYLKLSSSISPDKATLDQTAAIITGLVRDIDRCIADLKE
jgi:hypothetical protein